MMKIIPFMAVAGLLLFGSCSKEKTRYMVEYRIDVTETQSEYFKVYEVTDELGSGNGKWRGDFHKYDTVVENGNERIYAYGYIKDVARQGCCGLTVYQEGVNNHMKSWKLDTTFVLKIGVTNHFEITPAMKWIALND